MMQMTKKQKNSGALFLAKDGLKQPKQADLSSFPSNKSSQN